MKNTFKHIYTLLAVVAVGFLSSCEYDPAEPALEIANGAGTLTTYKAYTLDSIAGQNTEVYGKVVFWKSLDNKTLVQISLYNISESAEHASAILSGAFMTGGTELMSLYTITNTGEGYDFGEFSTSKFYIIDDAAFFEELDTYDASIQIFMSPTDNTVISGGDIGLNADPVE
ncbi:hypothetical protein N6H18_01680 [Reichenbachiella agarivorans]|uniref:CHRD domain-containing protein n=1 Tax=Reichenbachiella agarivorans TaxID=2979464 RepID=A0ABY6CQN7_9BACT|nr:hypothetical protein [Reichenbachiella agarivorans]UXP32674.1 hypothetical protein N6H18_01680 [Reichenbachiella agarivorans]